MALQNDFLEEVTLHIMVAYLGVKWTNLLSAIPKLQVRVLNIVGD